MISNLGGKSKSSVLTGFGKIPYLAADVQVDSYPLSQPLEDGLAHRAVVGRGFGESDFDCIGHRMGICRGDFAGDNGDCLVGLGAEFGLFAVDAAPGKVEMAANFPDRRIDDQRFHGDFEGLARAIAAAG